MISNIFENKIFILKCNYFVLSRVPLDYMERAGFMTSTGTSHLGVIEILRISAAHLT